MNVLLIALFAWAERRLILNTDEVAAADETVRTWREEIVVPLRVIRRQLESGPPPAPDRETENLRTMIKAAELRTEQVEQAMLASWLDRLAPHANGEDACLSEIVATVADYYSRLTGRGDARPFTPMIDIDISSLERELRP